METYDAFISYSHAKDKPVAAALQLILQRLGKPWYRRRALRIFRDDTSLSATPELWPSIEQALGRSRYFIALASPQFATSIWCTKEVAYWLEHKSVSTMLIVVTDGDLAWDNAAGDFIWNDTTPLPANLKARFRSEPKWIDLRPHREAPNARDQHLIERGADLAATIHGIAKDDLLSQEVQQQRRALTLAWGAAALLLLLASGAAWQWREAALAQQAAEVARDRATHNYTIAQQAAEEVAFKLVEDVSRIRGSDSAVVSAILQTAKSMIDQLAKADPENLYLQRTRAGLFSQFTNVYLQTGNLDDARAAADESLAIISRLVKVRPSNFVWRRDEGVSWEKVGDVRAASGDRDGALAAYNESLAIRRRLIVDFPGPGARHYEREAALSLRLIGNLHQQAGNRALALAAFDESAAITRSLVAVDPDDLDWQSALVDSLSAAAAIRADQGEVAAAIVLLTESLIGFRRLTTAKPENRNWQSIMARVLERLGNLYLRSNDRAAALNPFEENLAIRRKLLALDPGDTNSKVAVAAGLFNLGLVVPPARARPLLQEAVAMIEDLARNNQLTDETRGWPKLFAERLAQVPASD